MKRTLRRILLGSAAAIVVAGAGTFGTYWYKTGRFLESTDDAYVQADFTTIAPKVSGYIADVKVEDNQTVKAGDVLAVIDDRDFRTALVQAKADVASAKADVDNIEAQLEEQQSVIQQAEAAITADQAGVTFAQADYTRYHSLTAQKVTSVQDEQRAQSVLQQQNAELQRDRAALTAAKQRITVLTTAKAKAETQVQRLESFQAQAELNLSYTTITAPIDGTVGARSLRTGQYVQAGTQLMAVVPLKAGLCRRQLQGDPALRGPQRPAGRDQHRRPARHHREGHGRQPCAGERSRVRAAAAGQRHRQLHQDRAAHPGEDRARARRRPARPFASGHVGRTGDRHAADRRRRQGRQQLSSGRGSPCPSQKPLMPVPNAAHA